MKKILRTVMLVALCAATFCMATACGVGKDAGKTGATGPATEQTDPEKPSTEQTDPEKPATGDPEPGEPVTALDLQLDRVSSTYENIYASSERNGGLFAAPREELKFAAAKAAESTPTIGDVRDAIDRNAASGRETDNRYLFSTYVSDIFAYMQIQEALMLTHGKALLVSEFRLEYDDIDWQKLDKTVTGGVGAYDVQCSLLKTANIVGADEETGRVYGYQTHVSRSRRNVEAIAEYFYNGDGDFGVTTINRHYDPKSNKPVELVYHHCDMKTGTVVEVHFRIDGSGNVIGYAAAARTQTRNFSDFAGDDADILFEFAEAETARITAKSGAISAANLTAAEEEEIEIKEGQTCYVPLDFAVLRTMVGTLFDGSLQ